MTHRILEIIDGNGDSIFVPQFFNEYKGWKIFKFLAIEPNKWTSYTDFSQEIKFKTLQEANKFFKSFNRSTKVHKIND